VAVEEIAENHGRRCGQWLGRRSGE
jgi:hypothetical protein